MKKSIYIKQALVTCGGKGSRLSKSGVDFPFSKSFIELEGHTLFYWCLRGLQNAGVEDLVIVGDSKDKLKKAESVAVESPLKFSRIDLFQDSGLGTCGLPYQTRHLLDDFFLFECGHNIEEAEHYRKLEEQIVDEDSIVLSLFAPCIDAPRPHININKDKISVCNYSNRNDIFSVGTPSVLNQKYISNIPFFDFNFNKLLKYYCSNNKLNFVKSNMPVEVDVIEEWKKALPLYHEHIKKSYSQNK